MKIPSYDDLTPGISDVHPRDTFDQVTQLVSCDELVVRANGDTPSPEPRTPSPELYACIRARSDATSAALMALARDFSPRIERHDATCIVLDVSGLGRLLGDAHGIASELQRSANDRGLKVAIAIAPTQTAARLRAVCDRAVRGEVEPVVVDDIEHALAPVSLDVLEGLVAESGPAKGPAKAGPYEGPAKAGPYELLSDAVAKAGPYELLTSEAVRTFDALRRWGIRTIGEFAALPADEIAARFGQQGLAIQRMARGIDARPLMADPGVPRFVQSMELEWPIETLEPLSFVLARLLDPLAHALERAGKAGAAIRLDLRLVNRTTHSRVLQLPAPMRDPRVLRTLLALDLESHPPSAGIDVVTIEVDPAPSRIVQFSLLERAIPSPETLATLTARLNALVGEDRCGSPVLLDSHRPDAFAMARFAPDERASAKATARQAETNRPLLMLRRFRPPVAIRVSNDRGCPVHVAIDRRGMPGGRVQQHAGPWRTSGAWWQADGSHWDRDEWDVALSDGSVCRLYRDRETGKWFMEGVFD